MKERECITQQEIDEAIFDESIEAISITINHLKAELEATRKEIDEFVEQAHDKLFFAKLKAVVAILVLVVYVWSVIK